MEHILLYIVTISGFSGFMLGLYSLLVPALQRRGFSLPFVGRSPEQDGEFEDEYEDADPDDPAFAAPSFKTRRASLLDRLPKRRAQEDEDDLEDLEIDDTLIGDLDLSKERAEIASEAYDPDDDDLQKLTGGAEIDPILAALEDDEEEEEEEEDEEEDEEDAEEEEDGEEYEDEDEDGEEEEEEEAQPEQSAVHVVSGGGGDDFLALFNEGSNVTREVEAWRAELPDPTIAELLAEARAISEMFHGKPPTA